LKKKLCCCVTIFSFSTNESTKNTNNNNIIIIIILGLQNDIVLISLVAAQRLSLHLRDAARITVLLSRARHGS
jgi:hypothetical protein